MYKVMLVEDDYPVLELLSEATDWKKLGLTLQSTHENGVSALQYALQKEMPDILITDIGMPKMNGIELIKQMKEKNPAIQVSVLSCHSDYEFTRQALLLQVQDYLLKDTLKPEDFAAVLIELKKNIEQEQEKIKKETKLRQIAAQNQEALKRDFLRSTVYQSACKDEWYDEASSFGLDLRQSTYIPAFCFVQNHHVAKTSFCSDDQFAISISRLIAETLDAKVVHMPFSVKESFLLFPFHANVKTDCYGIGMECIGHIQAVVHSNFGVSLGFIIGEPLNNQHSFKLAIKRLLNSKNQRFYMKRGSIEKRKQEANRTEDVFTWYDKAMVEIRQLMIEGNRQQINTTVGKWVELLAHNRYSCETVKEWVLKLIVDLKIKLQTLPFYYVKDTAEGLHEELLAIDSLDELQVWLIHYFRFLLSAVAEGTSQPKRKEVLEALKYVYTHLEKKIMLEEVANHLFLNPSYFSRLFKKEVGETFVEHVTKAKINRAKELLEQTAEPVGKICERLGYDNQSYFIKVFKNHEGVTPIEYRGARA